MSCGRVEWRDLPSNGQDCWEKLKVKYHIYMVYIYRQAIIVIAYIRDFYKHSHSVEYYPMAIICKLQLNFPLRQEDPVVKECYSTLISPHPVLCRCNPIWLSLSSESEQRFFGWKEPSLRIWSQLGRSHMAEKVQVEMLLRYNQMETKLNITAYLNKRNNNIF